VQPIDLGDRELLDRAFGARNGNDFHKLYDGHWEGDYPSQSEADLAFCCIAAYWTGRDPERINSWLRSSGLYREKWDRADYRERTIAKAIETTREVYNPVAATSPLTSPQPRPEGQSEPPRPSRSPRRAIRSSRRGSRSTSWRGSRDRPSRHRSSGCSIWATTTCSQASRRRSRPG